MVFSTTAAAFAFDAWKEAGHEVALTVQGNSMWPLIRAGDEVFLSLLGPRELRLGDVVAFLAGNRVVVHRLVMKRKEREGWWCCEAGDNGGEWRWLPGRVVLGKVRLIRGSGRTIQLEVRPWTWVNCFLGVMLSLSVSLCEDFQKAASPPFLQQGARLLLRMTRKMLRAISRILLGGRRSPGVASLSP